MSDVPASIVRAWSLGKRRALSSISSTYVKCVELIWRVRLADMFDAGAYRELYPDVRKSGQNPMFHYLRFGAKEGRQPHPHFDTEYYVTKYPDVKRAWINPLVHYLKFGRKEGRLTERPTFLRGAVAAAFERNPELAHNNFSRVVRLRSRDKSPDRYVRVSARLDPEQVVLPDGEICISGWCFLDDGLMPDRIVAELGDKEIEVFKRQPRPDVAASLRDSSVAESGFVLRFPLPPWRPRIRLQAVLADSSRIEIATLRLRGRPSAARKPKMPFDGYAQWLDYERTVLSAEAARTIDTRVRPRISVLVPTFNSNLYFLSRCVESVRSQTYPNWELCIADDHSTDEAILAYLRSLLNADARIRVVFRERQGHISQATNSALAIASGDFVTFLDHDDELHPDALLEAARAGAECPQAKLIYSDEDKIDCYGRRSDPSFKPGFDLDLERSFNFVGRPIFVDRQTAVELGGVRDRCNGAQDWDIVMRFVERIEPDQIRHIPRPLYHWRKHPGSTALSIDAKPYVRLAWERVIEDHVSRTSLPAAVLPGLFDGSMRVRHQPGGPARGAVVLRDGAAGMDIDRLLSTISLSSIRVFEAGGSTGTLQELPSGRPVTRTEDLCADVVVVFTRPIESVNHRFFEEILGQARRRDCCFVTPVISGSDRKIIEAGLLLDDSGRLHNAWAGCSFADLGYMGLRAAQRRVPVAGGICFAASIQVVEEFGGIAALTAESPEHLAARLSVAVARAGKPALFTPYAVVTLSTPYERSNLPELASLEVLLREFAILGAVSLPTINPNLTMFSKIAEVFRHGL